MATTERKLGDVSASTSDTEPFEIVNHDDEVVSEREHGATNDLRPDALLQPSISSANGTDINVMDLQEMYDKLLLENAESSKSCASTQLLILGFTMHAARPLRLNELADIVDFALEESPPEPPKDLIRTSCGDLLKILGDETVQVKDPSVTDFIHRTNAFANVPSAYERSFPTLEVSEFHERAALLCLRYLDTRLALTAGLVGPNLVGQPWKGCPEYHLILWRRRAFEKVIANMNVDHPFLRYASSEWAFHASKCNTKDSEIVDFLTSFARPENQSFRTWAATEWAVGTAAASDIYPTQLHVAAYAGLSNAIHLLDGRQELDVECIDAKGRTPLWWAARRDHRDMATLLIQRGATLDKPDCDGIRPLHAAIEQRHSTIVQLLLQEGVDIRTVRPRERRPIFADDNDQTAAEYASKIGDAVTVAVMLPFASKEIVDMMVCWTCEFQNPAALQIILQTTDSSADSKLEGDTALNRAVRVKNLDCVKILLAHRVDVTALSRMSGPGPSQTALHTLCRYWTPHYSESCLAILDQLLNAGADVAALDENGDPPLLSSPSIYKTEESAMQYLLAAGADPKATGQNNESIIYRCLSNSWSTSNIDFLLDHGADLSTQTCDGCTIWHAIVKPDHLDKNSDRFPALVEYLVRKGAGPIASVADHNGRTGLEACAKSSYCSVDSFELLLNACPEVNALQRCLWLYEHREAKSFASYFRALVAAGVDLDVRDENGLPFLIRFVDRHFVNGDIELLLELGARHDVTDNDGKTLLHHYCEQVYFATADGFRGLVNRGLDPTKVDHNGQTILHTAIVAYSGRPEHLALIKAIIAVGVSPDKEDAKGRTALHLLLDSSPHKAILSRRKCEELIDVLRTNKHPLENEQIKQNTEIYLQSASKRSEYDVAYLIAAGANVPAPMPDGVTVLHLACRSQNAGVLGQLLAGEAEALKDTPSGSKGETPLHVVCRLGNFESCFYLLQSGVNVNACDRDGQTALHLLVSSKHWWQLEAIKLLIQHDADINAQDKSGQTPLHVLINKIPNEFSKALPPSSFWWPECLKILLHFGADPGVMDNVGNTALYLGTVNTDAMRMILTHNSNLDLDRPIFGAILNRNLASLDSLLKHGANPNCPYAGKRLRQWISLKNFSLTPLLLASFNRSHEGLDPPAMAPLISCLLEHGADPYAAINEHETLVHHVFEKADYETVCAFLDGGDAVDLATRDQTGRTIFHAASLRRQAGETPRYMHGKSTIPSRMIQAATDISAIDPWGRNLLHSFFASRTLSEKHLLELLDFNATHQLIHQTDAKGYTPMHYALKHLRPRLCQRLADLGADLVSVDPDGKTAFHRIAAQFFSQNVDIGVERHCDREWPEDCRRLWQRILSLGGDINGTDSNGWPPLFDFFAGPEPWLFSDYIGHIAGYPVLFNDADVHVLNYEGQNVLHIIANWHEDEDEPSLWDKPTNKTSFEVMVQKGVDPHAEDSNGRSSLDVAAARGRTDILDLFKE